MKISRIYYANISYVSDTFLAEESMELMECRPPEELELELAAGTAHEGDALSLEMDVDLEVMTNPSISSASILLEKHAKIAIKIKYLFLK